MDRIDETDFWRWAFSDLLSNTTRGVFAEYIVGRALECLEQPRKEWDSVDLTTASGLRVEVKSSAYLQSWTQKSHSLIRFDIAKKRGWNAETNESAAEARRSADVYVFCVFAAKEKPADPRDLTGWFFLVGRTDTLEARLGTRKSVTLAGLEAAGLTRVRADQIRAEVERVVAPRTVR